jgi:hypothetical protein
LQGAQHDICLMGAAGNRQTWREWKCGMEPSGEDPKCQKGAVLVGKVGLPFDCLLDIGKQVACYPVGLCASREWDPLSRVALVIATIDHLPRDAYGLNGSGELKPGTTQGAVLPS